MREGDLWEKGRIGGEREQGKGHRELKWEGKMEVRSEGGSE